ncbi:LuxR family transcriptional regulator [Hassallia byssoidea VB512170]|uniref:LuxR family transcriptional regulator n=1 Tax=Hassallia byssoidea VB512170 TaxID=1304833 RepID=A0A846HE53_9CYAN|nr:LuxR C-terminal-related transcriptional regulator [Hassalia byssoidea]NEU75606.1 LuxR family transcriptional regulator [Hassalia byssoidea VB512170]
MAKSLQSLFQAIALARNEQELRHRFMDGISDNFDVQRWGIYLLDEHENLASVDVRGVKDVFVERYEKVGRAVDPVLHYVLERHASAHEELVLPPGGWKQCELYKNCCSVYDHEHIMTGPIVGGGRLIGTIHFARVGVEAAFDYQNLADLNALCMHMSACLATLKTPEIEFNSLLANRLTPRELQIVELVAQGLTNAEIGAKLWIQENSVKQALKRLFRKLEVSNRAAMVAKLQDIFVSVDRKNFNLKK